MRWALWGMVSLSLATPLAAAESPLVEKYLHSGELARGEQALEAALAAAPQDDQLRFGLGALQFIRGVERLGQSLYEYGCRSENNNTPFLRIPVPQNPEPSPITYAALRRVLMGFQSDLATAEATLAGITADDVALPLRLADIRFDLTGAGDNREKLIDVLRRLMGPNFKLKADNPDFLVRFDRGDVAWLRAYCHLLMAMIDLQLAFDLEAGFDLSANELFAKPMQPFTGMQQEKWKKLEDIWLVLKVQDPARLGHFRQHLLNVCELNRETWKFIRAEQDDEYEWLPNPQQTGVIGLPVTNEMIDVWLAMVGEFDSLLSGKKVIPASMVQFLSPKAKKGLNLKNLLDDPPDQFDWDGIREAGVNAKYLDAASPDVNPLAFIRVMGVFQNALGVAYAIYFN